MNDSKCIGGAARRSTFRFQHAIGIVPTFHDTHIYCESFLLGLLTCHSKSTYSHRGCILWNTLWHSWCENNINDFYCVYFFGLGLWMGGLIGARQGCFVQPFAVGNVLDQAALQKHTMHRLNCILCCSEWWTSVLISTSCAAESVKSIMIGNVYKSFCFFDLMCTLKRWQWESKKMPLFVNYSEAHSLFSWKITPPVMWHFRTTALLEASFFCQGS